MALELIKELLQAIYNRVFMSLAQAISNSFSTESNFDQIALEEKANIKNYFRILSDHLNFNEVNLETSLADASAGKLSKLTIHHLMDLASDMCDEINRRNIGSNLPLPIKKDLNPKRNNARAKMAEFPAEKLNNLILEVVLEINRRHIHDPIDKFIEEDFKKRSSMDTFNNSQFSDNICESNSFVKKTKSNDINSQIQDTSFSSLKDESINPTGIFKGIDSLNSMIKDLGSLIGKDDSEEIDTLKQKYENEILQLKDSLTKYQFSIIPEKNREISKLMTRIEEFDLLNSRLRKEIISLNEKLFCKEKIIEDQKALCGALKECIDNIQNQIINRSEIELANARNSTRLEFISDNVFSDLNLNNIQITAGIEEIERCLLDPTQKNNILKLLRDIGTAAQSSLMHFDRILDASRSFEEMEDLCKKGELAKLSYIASLSLLIISGKDFNSRLELYSEFKSNIESFKENNDIFFDFKTQFEAAFQNV